MDDQVSEPTTQPSDEKAKKDLEEKNKALDWQIDKAQAVLIETNKTESTALLSYLTLIITTSLLIFGDKIGVNGQDHRATIPLIQITLNQYAAATITLFLSSAALFWFYASSIMGGLISNKLQMLFYRRHRGGISAAWHLQHPSLFGLSGMIFSYRRVGNMVQGLAFTVFMVASFVYPVILAFILGRIDHDSTWLRWLLVIGIIVSVFPSAATLPPVRNLQSAVEKLDAKYDVTPMEVDSITDIPKGKKPIEL